MTGEARMDRDPEFQEILSLLPGTVLGRGMEQFTKSGYRPSLAAYTDEKPENLRADAAVLRTVSGADR